MAGAESVGQVMAVCVCVNACMYVYLSLTITGWCFARPFAASPNTHSYSTALSTETINTIVVGLGKVAVGRGKGVVGDHSIENWG